VPIQRKRERRHQSCPTVALKEEGGRQGLHRVRTSSAENVGELQQQNGLKRKDPSYQDSVKEDQVSLVLDGGEGQGPDQHHIGEETKRVMLCYVQSEVLLS
jgi:hypothetical protein